MKKILGIIVLGLLLSGCASQETKQKQRTNSNMAATELVKKGFNTFFTAYGHSKQDAINKALELCQIKRKEIGKGRCRVSYNCDSKGYECASGSRLYSLPSKTTKTTSSGSKIDPTVWDDLLKMGGVKSGSSTSSSSSSSSTLKSTCYNTGEETGGTNKSCKYSCSGNLYTMTISSLEICPVKIQN